MGVGGKIITEMITEIGIVAGEIWSLLEKKGDVSLRNVVKMIDKPRELILMSIGWLAREGHIVLKREDNDYKVCLR